MNSAYRSTLVITALAAALCLITWQLLQIEESARAQVYHARTLAPSQPSASVSPGSTSARVSEHDNIADLIDAARRGDAGGVRSLVAKGVSINATGSDGLTPLLATIQKGNVSPGIIEQLLKAGADIRARDQLGRDALTLAAEKDDVNALAELLKHSKSQVLHAAEAMCAAASNSHVEALRTLLDNGVDVNKPTSSGKTALTAAIQQGDADTVRFLTSEGADPNRKTDNGQTLLMLAVSRGVPDIVRAVAEKSNEIDARNSAGETALLQSVRAKQTDCVKALMESGADINAADAESTSPLMAAAAAGNSDVVDLLLSKGVDLAGTDSHGETAVSLARKNGHDDLAELLKRAGAAEPPKP